MSITQSTLTINGIGADPSGSRPIGDLNKYWDQVIYNETIKYTPSSLGIMADPGASSADATDTYYSEVLEVGPLDNVALNLGDMGNAQIKACWQWYSPMSGTNGDSGSDVDFSSTRAGAGPSTFGNGTWVDVTSPAQDVASYTVHASSGTSNKIRHFGTKLRVKMVVTDAGSDGVAAGLVTTAVDMINSSATYCYYPHNKKATYLNDGLDTSISGDGIGGIGADPS